MARAWQIRETRVPNFVLTALLFHLIIFFVRAHAQSKKSTVEQRVTLENFRPLCPLVAGTVPNTAGNRCDSQRRELKKSTSNSNVHSYGYAETDERAFLPPLENSANNSRTTEDSVYGRSALRTRFKKKNTLRRTRIRLPYEGKSSPIYLLSCGKYTSSTIYDTQKEGRHLTSLEHLQKKYYDHVIAASDEARWTSESFRRLGRTKSFRITFMSWNAELLIPEPIDIISPFSPITKTHLQIEEQDVVVVALQENIKPQIRVPLVEKIRKALNNLNSKEEWIAGEGTGLYLRTLYGTKIRWRKPFEVNSQGLFWFKRKDSPIEGVRNCRYALRASEKGFVASVLHFPGVGNALFGGLHVSRERSAAELTQILKLIEKECVPRSAPSAPRYFSAGIYLGGDFNTRLSSSSLNEALAAVEGNSLYPLLTAQSTYNSPVNKLLQAFDPKSGHLFIPQDFHQKYATLLWAADTFGAGSTDSASDVRQALLAHGYRDVSVCYQAGFTYDYSKTCRPRLTKFRTRPIDLMSECLTWRARTDPNQIGFLDRLVMKKPEAFTTDSGNTLYTTSVIENAFQLMNFRSDHMLQVWEIGLYRLATGNHQS